METTLTPMLKQYRLIKSKHQDCILFFRLGDFYEMFYEDAKTASKILDLVLTSRDAGKSGKIPMCGIPFHAADSYIARLIKNGYKVAICEQVEDPASTKGLVRREVIRIITSGTYIDEQTFDFRYIASISSNKNHIGLSFTDNSSGTIYTFEHNDWLKITEILCRLPIYECVFPQQAEEAIKTAFNHPLLRIKNITLSPYQDWMFNLETAQETLKSHLKVSRLEGFGVDPEKHPQAIASAGALLEYLKEMNKQPLLHIDRIALYSEDDYAVISASAIQGLDLENLFKTIDHTLTAMGKRCLKYWLYHPLKDKDKIVERQKAVCLLKENPNIQSKLANILKTIPDIEKNISRISCGIYQPKDFLALRNSLMAIPQIQEITAPLLKQHNLFTVTDPVNIRKLLEKAINPNIPLSNPEGKTISQGYCTELDELRNNQNNGKAWLKDYQKKEIERTKINSLKIGFNKVFGYYIEITKPNLHLIPQDYIRKQTLVNAERFITPELKEFEEKMLSAESRILEIERRIMNEIRDEILKNTFALHEFTRNISVLDSLYSLAVLSNRPGYNLPQITQQDTINITAGRHPIVECSLTQQFIPNNTLLDCENNRLLIITGPNMAGKSTYIRQVGLLVILAQMGSFIPAEKAEIGIADKIFTRIGARDEIAKGQSTFMVEMLETAEILNNLTPKSLVILDEIGRGTSTLDGLSLAWAVLEYLQKQKTRTLFATHFHELADISREYAGVKNYNVAVKEWGNEIIFLHKITPGSTDHSYGIYVAQLAGIPKKLIFRAQEILKGLEKEETLKKSFASPKTEQLTFFNQEEEDKIQNSIKKELDALDINSLSPLEALNKINAWKKQIKENE